MCDEVVAGLALATRRWLERDYPRSETWGMEGCSLKGECEKS
jgi:hypothetical protein